MTEVSVWVSTTLRPSRFRGKWSQFVTLCRLRTPWFQSENVNFFIICYCRHFRRYLYFVLLSPVELQRTVVIKPKVFSILIYSSPICLFFLLCNSHKDSFPRYPLKLWIVISAYPFCADGDFLVSNLTSRKLKTLEWCPKKGSRNTCNNGFTVYTSKASKFWNFRGCLLYIGLQDTNCQITYILLEIL